MKKVKNLMIGTLAFSASLALATYIVRKNRKVEEVIEENEEIERKYVDISEQLKTVKEENEELKEKVLQKEYKD